MARGIAHETPHHGSITALRTPDRHVSRSQRAQQTGKCDHHRAIKEPKIEKERSEETHGEVVEGYVGAVPEDHHLRIASDRGRFSLMGWYTPDPTSFEASE